MTVRPELGLNTKARAEGLARQIATATDVLNGAIREADRLGLKVEASVSVTPEQRMGDRFPRERPEVTTRVLLPLSAA